MLEKSVTLLVLKLRRSKCFTLQSLNIPLIDVTPSVLSVRVVWSVPVICVSVELPGLKRSPRLALVELLSVLLICVLVELTRLRLKTYNPYRQHWLCQTRLGLFWVH